MPGKLLDELLLDAKFRVQIKQFVMHPPHAILLQGPAGSGKQTVAVTMLHAMLGLKPAQSLDSYPYFVHAIPVNQTHSIDTIRSLHDFMRLKTTGRSVIRRAVLIEDAHTLTIEAQNAFLKLLEEPPSDTVIVLTCVGNRSLLPTIYSRVQNLTVKSITKDAAHAYFTSADLLPADIERAYLISDGHVGLMQALLRDESSHPLATAIRQAKELLTMSAFERIAIADKLSKQKDEVPQLLLAMERISHAALIQASLRDKTMDVRKWTTTLKRIVHARQALPRNPQTKLLLTDLFLTL